MAETTMLRRPRVFRANLHPDYPWAYECFSCAPHRWSEVPWLQVRAWKSQADAVESALKHCALVHPNLT